LTNDCDFSDESPLIIDKHPYLTDKQNRCLLAKICVELRFDFFSLEIVFMKLRFLHLGNDFWFRVLLVPFMGFSVPYITSVIPDGYTHQTFITTVPSLYTLPIIFFIFECNRILLGYYKDKFKKGKNFDGYSVVLVRRVIFQLLITAALMFFALYIWYDMILLVDDFYVYIYNNLFVGLAITLAIILFYSFFFD
jgi:hypothetical protein